MKKQVTVTAQPTLLKDGSKNPNAGKVFTQSVNADGSAKLDKNGKPFGFIRVEQKEVSLGFAYNRGAIKSRSALISMTTEAWAKSASAIKDGIKADGHIVRHDALEAFYPGQKPMQTAEGKVITANGGAPVYRNELFTEDQLAEDVKLAGVYDIIEETVTAGKSAQALNS